MKKFAWVAVMCAGTGLSLLMAACGGGGGTPPPPTTYTLHVASANPATGVSITVSPADANGASSGSTSFSRTYNAGTVVTLTAPAVSGGNAFASWTGCATATTVTCTMTMNANATVTANFSALPTTYTLTVNSVNPASGVSMAVTPDLLNPLSYQANTSFTVSAAAGVNVGLIAPATVGSNSFSSWAGCTTVNSVNCTVTMNADTTVTVTYASPGQTTPTVTVTPSASSITTAQPLSVTVTVSGGSGNPTPTGSVNLINGSYSSGLKALTNGSVTINIAPGKLAVGPETLAAFYTPDAASSSTYTSSSGTGTVTITAPVTYTLTINSTAPASGVDISAVPADNAGKGFGPTPLTLTYNAGTTVALGAPTTSQGFAFLSWSGCATASSTSCSVTMNGNTTVTANYNQPSVTSVTVSPNAATIGTTQQFTATVAGTGNFSHAVTWSLSCPACGSLSPGTLSSTGLYNTPYPAPASVVITAKSTQSGFTNISGSVTVALAPPSAGTGPALTVDTGNQTRPISPNIYGMNGYALADSVITKANIPLIRWGGDNTERYNYKINATNSIDDWYFENGSGAYGEWPDANFDHMVSGGATAGIKVLGTVPVLGWVAKDATSCSYPKSTYPNQLAVNGKPAFDSGHNCGSGVYPNGVGGCTNANGCNIGAVPTVTSIPAPPPALPAATSVNTAWADATWTGGWVQHLVDTYGTAANGGVAFYDLDNEPSWWDSNDIDVHPLPFTYDEMTNGGIGTALAIKTIDPAAAVNGPVMDYWWAYFYSKKDIENGWGNGSPCWQPWSNPIDREAHGGVPLIEYYLQQFAAAESTYGMRLLDYVDLHTYFAANNSGLNTAGDTQMQTARLNSTRALWDPTYTDPNFPQPNYKTDANYTASCNLPLQAPQAIPMMQDWVDRNYPGTKTAITEYNWGAQEHINGAVAQADVLGIFGAYGLDMATLWGPPDPSTQKPGLMAYEIYRNYDGAKSAFGETALASNSADQGKLSVYGAVRSLDSAITVVVINKTYGDLTSTLSLANMTNSSATAQSYLYSNANLNAIVGPSSVAVTPLALGSTTGTISATFPAQSITLFVVPQ